MAQMKITLFSKALSRFTDFELIYPCDTPPEMSANEPCYQRPCKTMIALHGYSNDYHEWIYNSPVQFYAMKYNLAILCPSGENSFYLNRKGTGRAYADFIGRDLIAFLRDTFGLARGPEDTFIAGTSMGGYGALHAGLSDPGTFGHVIALSSALIHHEVAAMKPGDGNPVADDDYYASTFGAPEELLGSENEPEGLVKRLQAAGTPVPGIFMACGTEDFLLEPNRAFHQFLTDQKVPVTYTESPGRHDWVFWDQYIEPGIRWALGMPEG